MPQFMIAQRLTDGWKNIGEPGALEEVIQQARKQSGSVVAVFPVAHWNEGQPTCKARYLWDRRDKSSSFIYGLSGLINSVPVEYLG